ncbi:hypothetical protein [Pseudonocardia sp. ICBG1034]|uniref:hypothetical protein n=1 Tax=Pseudonocardia sp. ICBG1034 TaxID=2844381 RepID=UPI001CC972C0|nr:hypothetical protein [Pseudonocardia sp. ICBG1034]
MLAAQTAEYDTVGQWMSHHLAELVVAAEDDSTTVEQRLEIVDTILKIWAHRRTLEGPRPLEDFSRVFAALDRLGDERPWRFLRLFAEGSEPPPPTASGPRLLDTAAALEKLARETVLHLLWRAAEEATSSHQEWLDVAARIQSDVEVEVTDVLRRLHRSVERRRLVVSAADADDDAESQAPARADQPAYGEDPPSEGLFSDGSYAQLLRDMAGLLGTIADGLDFTMTDE